MKEFLREIRDSNRAKVSKSADRGIDRGIPFLFSFARLGDSSMRHKQGRVPERHTPSNL